MPELKAEAEADQAQEIAASGTWAPRKPWSKPILTVRSIDDVTRGLRTSTRTDVGAGDNYIS